jgi:hypothetical protein
MDDNEFARYLASYLESNRESFGDVYDVDELERLIKEFMETLP